MRTKLVAAAIASVLVATLGSSATATTGGPIALTTSGAVRGTSDGVVDRFSAIPYAAPPVGALRWRPPAPAKPWAGVRDATRQPALCVQSANGKRLPGSTEDCLFVNVTRPDGRPW